MKNLILAAIALLVFGCGMQNPVDPGPMGYFMSVVWGGHSEKDILEITTNKLAYKTEKFQADHPIKFVEKAASYADDYSAHDPQFWVWKDGRKIYLIGGKGHDFKISFKYIVPLDEMDKL